MVPLILCLMLSGCAMTSKAEPSAAESAQAVQAETQSEPATDSSNEESASAERSTQTVIV